MNPVSAFAAPTRQRVAVSLAAVSLAAAALVGTSALPAGAAAPAPSATATQTTDPAGNASTVPAPAVTLTPDAATLAGSSSVARWLLAVTPTSTVDGDAFATVTIPAGYALAGASPAVLTSDSAVPVPASAPATPVSTGVWVTTGDPSDPAATWTRLATLGALKETTDGLAPAEGGLRPTAAAPLGVRAVRFALGKASYATGSHALIDLVPVTDTAAEAGAGSTLDAAAEIATTDTTLTPTLGQTSVAPALPAALTLPAAAAPGAQVTGTFTVTNTTDHPLVLTETLSGATVGVAGNPSAAPAQETVKAGESYTVPVTVTTPTDGTGAALAQATVTASDPREGHTDDPALTTATDTLVRTSTVAVPTVSLLTDTSTLAAGGKTSYTLWVTNDGTAPATGHALLVLPDQLTADTKTPGGTSVGDVTGAGVDLGTLAPGATASLTVPATVSGKATTTDQLLATLAQVTLTPVTDADTAPETAPGTAQAQDADDAAAAAALPVTSSVATVQTLTGVPADTSSKDDTDRGKPAPSADPSAADTGTKAASEGSKPVTVKAESANSRVTAVTAGLNDPNSTKVVARNDVAATPTGRTVSVRVLSNDDNAKLALLASNPAHGHAVCSADSCSYTPAAGYTGVDTFTYLATGKTGSAQAQVSIQVGQTHSTPSAVPTPAPGSKPSTGTKGTGGSSTTAPMPNDTTNGGKSLAWTGASMVPVYGAGGLIAAGAAALAGAAWPRRRRNRAEAATRAGVPGKHRA